MIAFCEDIGLQPRFLDLEYYRRWTLRDRQSPESPLVDWSFFELYMRGSNFGAAGDMPGNQILHEEGEMYCDHGDDVTWMHKPETVPQKDLYNGQYCGFKHALISRTRTISDATPTTGYLVVLTSHSFLEAFGGSMLDSSSRLPGNKYMCKSPRTGEGFFKSISWYDYSQVLEGSTKISQFVGYPTANIGPD